jgi:hypothetical protein
VAVVVVATPVVVVARVVSSLPARSHAPQAATQSPSVVVVGNAQTVQIQAHLDSLRLLVAAALVLLIRTVVSVTVVVRVAVVVDKTHVRVVLVPLVRVTTVVPVTVVVVGLVVAVVAMVV